MKEPFTFDEQQIVLGRFIRLRRQNKGQAQAVLFSRQPLSSDLLVDSEQSLNGNCKYKFVYSDSVLCGVLIESPRHLTSIEPWGLSIKGNTDDIPKFEHNAVFCPQGIHVFSSPDDAVVLVTSVDTPLLVHPNEA